MQKCSEVSLFVCLRSFRGTLRESCYDAPRKYEYLECIRVHFIQPLFALFMHSFMIGFLDWFVEECMVKCEVIFWYLYC